MQSNFQYNPSGKRAIVTGGARGIGYEYAEQLLSSGAKVCLSDINAKIGNEAAEKLRQEYGVGKDRSMLNFLISWNMQVTTSNNILCSVHFVECDVIIKDEWVKMWDEAEEVLGGKIEILCNNAGVPRLVG